jgi:hypothetical protein
MGLTGGFLRIPYFRIRDDYELHSMGTVGAQIDNREHQP